MWTLRKVSGREGFLSDFIVSFLLIFHLSFTSNLTPFCLLTEESRSIIIISLFDSNLHFLVKNETIFFTLEGENNGVILGKDQSQTLSLRLNTQAIKKHSQLLLKDKYIEEHITIYNRDRLSEKIYITLQLSLGKLSGLYLYATATPVHALPLKSSEQLVVCFLQRFKGFWDDFPFPRQPASVRTSHPFSPSPSSNSLGTLLSSPSTSFITLPSVEGATYTSQELDSALEDLFGNYCFIKDELLFFALKSKPAQQSVAYLDVAILFFTSILRHKVFFTPPQDLVLALRVALSRWTEQLSHFLRHFPESTPQLRVLRTLETNVLVASLLPK
jgi:hypothetical protein